MLSKPLHINAFFVIKGKVCSLVVYSFRLVRRADGQRLQINYSWLIIDMQVERTRKKALLTLRGSHVHERTICSAVIHKEHVQLEVVQTTRTDHVLQSRSHFRFLVQFEDSRKPASVTYIG